MTYRLQTWRKCCSAV